MNEAGQSAQISSPPVMIVRRSVNGDLLAELFRPVFQLQCRGPRRG